MIFCVFGRPSLPGIHHILFLLRLRSLVELTLPRSRAWRPRLFVFSHAFSFDILWFRAGSDSVASTRTHRNSLTSFYHFLTNATLERRLAEDFAF